MDVRAPVPSFSRLASLLAFLIPLAAALGNLDAGPSWNSDRPLVRSLTSLPTLDGGMLSGVLTRMLFWCPLGNPYERVGAVAALGLAGFGLVTYHLSFRWLETTQAPQDRCIPWVALLAALLATVTPRGLYDATGPSEAPLAAALALALLAPGRPSPRKRSPALLGITAASLALEAPRLLVLVVAVNVLRSALVLDLPPRRHVGRLAGSFVFTALVLALPVGLRAHANGTWDGLTADTLGPLADQPFGAQGPTAAWGSVTLLFAGIGLVQNWRQPAHRRWLLSGALLYGAWALAGTSTLWDRWPELAPCTEWLTNAALSVTACSAALSCFHALRQRSAGLRRWVTALVPALATTMVLVNYEDATRSLAERVASGTEAWTEEALAALPARATLLLGSHQLVWRLRAEQLTTQARPDLLLVPLDGLADGAVTRSLLEREPALGPVLRDVALYGRPSERALVHLADARAVFVDLDRPWEPRLLNHLLPRGFWLEFSAFPVGHTDRKLAFAADLEPMKRVLQPASSLDAPDPQTLQVARAQVRQQLQLFDAVGDRRQLRTALEAFLDFDAQNPLLLELRRELETVTGHPSGGLGQLLGLAETD